MNQIIKLPGELIDLDVIANSGQCFRWKEGEKKGSYYIPVSGRYAIVWKDDNNWLCIHDFNYGDSGLCEKSYLEEFWSNYFNLKNLPRFWDYAKAYCNEYPSLYLAKVCKYGEGMTILNQSVFETLISFIISQNNNISRIKKSIEKLCVEIGNCQKKGGVEWYDFPSYNELVSNLYKLDDMGLGYRKKYVENAVYDYQLDPSAFDPCDYKEDKSFLMEMDGVGPKVADCVCLYGLNHYEAFPTDTHIKQAISREFPDGLDLSGEWGQYAGFLQQLIFYYEINHKPLEM